MFRTVLLVGLLPLLMFTQAQSTEPSARPRALDSVGVSLGNLSNPFFYQMGKAIEQRAKRLSPQVRIQTLSADLSADGALERQTRQIDGFIRDRVDLIILNAVDSVRIAPAIRRAKAAGIVVVAVDVGAEGGVDLTITSDNVLAGRQACAHLAILAGNRGNFVILNGPPVTAVIDRVTGCKKELARHPLIHIVSSQLNARGVRDGGYSTMQQVLASGVKVSAVFAINDPIGMGAAQALQEAGLRSVPLTAVDGAPDAEVLLGGHDSNFRATAAQFPFRMAARAVDEGYAMVQGKTPRSEVVLIPTQLITPANLKAYQGWQKLPRE